MADDEQPPVSSEPTPARPANERSQGGRRGSSRASTGTGSSPFAPESAPFVAGDEPQPAQPDVEHDLELELEPEPIVWTPERTGYVLRGAGFLVHTADPLSREPEGEELWRMTEGDLEAMAPPLASILNRYAPARRLAGFSEEGALAFGMLAYAKRNLSLRGRVVTAKAEREGPEPEVQWPNRGVNPDAQDGLGQAL